MNPAMVPALTHASEQQSSIVRLSWTSILAAHLAALAYGLVSNQLIAGVASASLALVILLYRAIQHREFTPFALVIPCVAGNVASLGYANYVYFEFSSFRRGSHHDLTAWLAALLCWTVVLGAFSANAILGPERSHGRSDLLDRWQTMALATVILLIFAILYIVGGDYDARWEVLDATGIRYFAYGASSLLYIFFYLLGTRMAGPILAPRNLAIVGCVCALAGLQSLSGGREASLWMCLFMLLGATISDVSRRGLFALAGALAVSGVLFVAIIGEARAKRHFGYGSLEDRSQAIAESARTNIQDEEDSETNPIITFANRFFEMSGQDVIDQTLATQRFVGFEHAERLLHIFAPKVRAPDQPIDDNVEVLIRDFGYEIAPRTGIPIPLVADAYRRGGLAWVAAAGMLLGLWLRIVVRFTLWIAGPRSAPIALAIPAVTFFRSYPYGVLGTIYMFTYGWLKFVLLVVAFAWMARLLIWATEGRPLDKGARVALE